MAARRTLSSLQAAHQHLISNISRQDTAAAGQQAGGMRAGLWEPGLVVEEMSWVLRILVIKLCVCILKCVCVCARAFADPTHTHTPVCARVRACIFTCVYACTQVVACDVGLACVKQRSRSSRCDLAELPLDARLPLAAELE